MELAYRKRHRIPASCSVCRKRKSRCDRVKPVCGSCKKKSIAHLCYYEAESKDQPDTYSPFDTGPYNAPQPMEHPHHVAMPQQHQKQHHQHQQHQLPQQLPQLPQHPPPLQSKLFYQSPPQSHPIHSQHQPSPQSHHIHSQPPHISPPYHQHHQLPHLPQYHPQDLTHNGDHRPQHFHHSHPPVPPAPSGPAHPGDAAGPPGPPGPPGPLGPPTPSISVLGPPTNASSGPPSQTSSRSVDTQLPPPNLLPLPTTGSNQAGSLTNMESDFASPQRVDPHGTIYDVSRTLSGFRTTNPNAFPRPYYSPIPPYTPSNHSKQFSYSTLPHDGPLKRDSLPRNIPDPEKLDSEEHLKIQNHRHEGSGSGSGSGSNGGYNGSDGATPPQPSTSGNHNLVSVSLGPNSALKVNPNDTMTLFSNANYSFNVEGSKWQQQGTMSYIGLTKSDPFIKILRSYAVLLLRSGSMAQFMKNEGIKRKTKESVSSASSKNSTISDDSPVDLKRPRPMSLNSGSIMTTNSNQELKVEINADPNDVIKEDGLLVDRIVINKEDDDSKEGSGKNTDQSDTEREQTNSEHTKKDAGVDKKEASGNEETPKGPSESRKSKSGQFKLGQILPVVKMYGFDKKSKTTYYQHVSNVIIEILPTKKILYKLFCRFYHFVRPFVPIMEQAAIQEEVAKILPGFSSMDDDYYTEMNIENDEDLIVLGILLLNIRLGYLSLIHNDDSHNQYNDDEEEMTHDMKRLNSETFSGVLKMCISDSPIASKSSFKLVQCLTLLYFYRRVVPDDCHGLGGADAHVLFGVIMTHAVAIGLNRDPTNYVSHGDISKHESLIKTWRLLWFHLTCTDSASAIHSGTPLKYPYMDTCDVQSPIDDVRSPGFNSIIHNMMVVTESYRNIANKLYNLRVKPKVIDLLVETNLLERNFFEFFGKDFFKDCICKPAKPEPAGGFKMGSMEREESDIKVMKFCTFIQLRTNLSCLYYMIAIHYENEYNESKTPSMLAGIEIFKIFCKSVLQLVYIMSYVLDNSVELFGRNYDYILTANNEKCMIKTHSFLTSFFVRLLHHKKDCAMNVDKDPSLKPRLEVMDQLFKIVLIEAELFVGNFRKLSRTYINSYKLYVMTYYVLRQCMENPSVFFEKTMMDARFDHEGTNMLEFFSTYELQYLCKLCEDFRTAKEEQIKFKRSQNQKNNAPGGIRPANAMPFNLPFPASYNAIPSINFLNVSPLASQGLQESNSSNSSVYNSSQPTPVSAVNSGSNVPLPLNSKDNYIGSLESVNSAELEPPVYSNLNNCNYGIFGNPEAGGDDLLRLFEVYVDFDTSD